MWQHCKSCASPTFCLNLRIRGKTLLKLKKSLNTNVYLPSQSVPEISFPNFFLSLQSKFSFMVPNIVPLMLNNCKLVYFLWRFELFSPISILFKIDYEQDIENSFIAKKYKKPNKRFDKWKCIYLYIFFSSFSLKSLVIYSFAMKQGLKKDFSGKTIFFQRKETHQTFYSENDEVFLEKVSVLGRNESVDKLWTLRKVSKMLVDVEQKNSGNDNYKIFYSARVWNSQHKKFTSESMQRY